MSFCGFGRRISFFKKNRELSVRIGPSSRTCVKFFLVMSASRETDCVLIWYTLFCRGNSVLQLDGCGVVSRLWLPSAFLATRRINVEHSWNNFSDLHKNTNRRDWTIYLSRGVLLSFQCLGATSSFLQRNKQRIIFKKALFKSTERQRTMSPVYFTDTEHVFRING